MLMLVGMAGLLNKGDLTDNSWNPSSQREATGELYRRLKGLKRRFLASRRLMAGFSQVTGQVFAVRTWYLVGSQVRSGLLFDHDLQESYCRVLPRRGDRYL